MLIRQHAITMVRMRVKHRSCVIFFCSSAGEYEQARPLIDRLLAREQPPHIHVFFFSRSGIEFMHARRETIAHSLAPIDTVWHWGTLFAALQPDACIVVRHEWWPGFLATAREYAKVCLIDGTRSPGTTLFKRSMKARLAGFFDRIFVVGPDDADWFSRELGITRARLAVVGDTKYDRARDRVLSNPNLISSLATDLERVFPERYRLVAGSVHTPDVAALCAAFRKLDASTSKKWLLVLVPHEVSQGKTQEILAQVRSAGLRIVRMSQLADESGPISAEVLLVDRMGILAELYGVARLGYIGGAMHHKVHNVLEAAAHGLAAACGPYYKNSAEAVRLVGEGMLKVVTDADRLTNWWQENASRTSQPGQSAERVAALCGATALIIPELDTVMRKSPT